MGISDQRGDYDEEGEMRPRRGRGFMMDLLNRGDAPGYLLLALRAGMGRRAERAGDIRSRSWSR